MLIYVECKATSIPWCYHILRDWGKHTIFVPSFAKRMAMDQMWQSSEKCPDKDSNLGYPDYRADALPVEPLRSTDEENRYIPPLLKRDAAKLLARACCGSAPVQANIS